MSACLTIDATHLREAIRPILKASRKSAASEITFSYENDHLVITMAGVAGTMPATGEWSGVATVHARALAALVEIRGALIEVRFGADGLLHVGTMTLEARWYEGSQYEIDLPIDPTIRQILRLRVLHSDQELFAQGLLERVTRAERDMERCIGNAARQLESLGDFRASIAKLVKDEVFSR